MIKLSGIQPCHFGWYNHPRKEIVPARDIMIFDIPEPYVPTMVFVAEDTSAGEDVETRTTIAHDFWTQENGRKLHVLPFQDKEFSGRLSILLVPKPEL